MRMKLFMFYIAIIGFYSCSEHPKSSIKGIWIDDRFDVPMYFGDQNCMLASFNIEQYSIEGDQIRVESSDGEIDKYQYVVDKDCLFMRSLDNGYSVDLIRGVEVQNIDLKDFYFSSAGEINEFDLYINSDKEFLLDIKFFWDLEHGKYGGVLDDDTYELLLNLIGQMDLSISNDLSKDIISDIQEWGLEINTNKGEKFMLYHNYLGINRNHNAFAIWMSLLPRILPLEKCAFKDELVGIHAFRESEFDRNVDYWKCANIFMDKGF